MEAPVLVMQLRGIRLNQWDEGRKVLGPLVEAPALVMQLRWEIILNIFKMEIIFKSSGTIVIEQKVRRYS